MENKDLVWQDNKICWPNNNTVYYDTEHQIDKLDELKNLFRCSEIYFRIEDNTKPAKVLFYAQNKQLVSINGYIEIFYPRRVAKVNMWINGEKCSFTPEDGLWE